MNAVADPAGALVARLRQLAPGVHNAGRIGEGAWAMVGRAVPERVTWTSVPPADSVSILWGAGTCTVEDAGSAVALDPAGAVWIPRGCAHRGDGSAGSDFLTLFLGPPVDPTDRDDPLRASGIRAVDWSSEARRALLAAAVAMLDDAPQADLDVALAAVRAAVRPLADDVPEPALSPAEAALLDRFDEPLPIAAFSALARQSPPAFSRFFRRAWGLAPTQFRKQLRLLHGTHALVRGHSVTQAALDAGFADTAHFTRTFREQYGEAPSAWARAVGARG